MADQIIPSGSQLFPERWKDMGDGTFARVGASRSIDANGNATSSVASTGATVSVASSASAVTIKAANAARVAITIANDSTAILYVLLGAGTVSSTLYTYSFPAKGTTASDRTISGYTGIITGIWASANGNALVTELT